MKRFNALNLAVLAALASPSLFVEGEPSAAPGGGSTTPAPTTDTKVGHEAKKAARKPSKAKVTKTAAAPKAKKAAPKKAKAKKSGDVAESTAALSEAAKNYVKPKGVKTAGGNQAIDNGDKTAKMLRGQKLDDVYKTAARILKEPESALRAKYKHLNEGMQRMNLGNRIRAAG